MNMLALAAVALAVISVIKAEEVCYGSLGCFADTPPWDNTGYLPQAPSVVTVKHYFYSQSRPKDNQALDLDWADPSMVLDGVADLKPFLPCKVLIHGYMSHGLASWKEHIKDAILEHEDVNVYTVGWSGGAGTMYYYQAAANIRVVAAEVKVILEELVARGAALEHVHIIGHSLGAQVAGEVGRLFKGKIGRITGMDPASPGFEPFSAQVRLDQSDAKFVDVIHTDGDEGGDADGIVKKTFFGGAGVFEQSGDVDVYVNGGEDQPGCKDGVVGLFGRRRRRRSIFDGLINYISDKAACSHTSVHKLMIESIYSQCPFTAYSCSSYERFQNGDCLDCQNGGCTRMGYHAQPSDALGRVYMNTLGGTGALCGYHYKISLVPTVNTYGILQVKLDGTKGSTELLNFKSGDVWKPQGGVISGLVLSSRDVGAVTSLTLKYTWNSWIYDPTTLEVKDVLVKVGVTGVSYHPCPGIIALTSGTETDIDVFSGQSFRTDC